MKLLMLFAKSARNNAFTIVELLIVISVLGILLTISVVAYNGAQLNARNAQTAAAVKAYKDALTLYYQDNGTYPSPTVAGSRPCLGTGYVGGCWSTSGVIDTTFMSTLTTTAGGSLPSPALPNITLKGVMYVPQSIGYKVDGASYAAATPVSMLVYSVEGSGTRCPVGPVASKPSNGNSQWFSSTAPSNGQTYAASSGNPVQCWVPLPWK